MKSKEISQNSWKLRISKKQWKIFKILMFDLRSPKKWKNFSPTKIIKFQSYQKWVQIHRDLKWCVAPITIIAIWTDHIEIGNRWMMGDLFNKNLTAVSQTSFHCLSKNRVERFFEAAFSLVTKIVATNLMDNHQFEPFQWTRSSTSQSQIYWIPYCMNNSIFKCRFWLTEFNRERDLGKVQLAVHNFSSNLPEDFPFGISKIFLKIWKSAN